MESIRREKTQNFLIQKITDEVLKLRNIKLEHLRGEGCCAAKLRVRTSSIYVSYQIHYHVTKVI